MRPPRPTVRRVGSVEQLLAAVVAGYPVSTAATMAQMGEETARRRLRDPEIRQRLDEMRAATLAQAADKLTSLASRAADVLGRIMDDPTMPGPLRVRAAEAVLARVTPLRDAATVDERLAQIEAAIARREQWSRSA